MNSKGIYNKKKYFSLELLDILNKIFSYLDKDFEKIKERPQDQIVYEVVNFIKVLNYPIPNPPQDV